MGLTRTDYIHNHLSVVVPIEPLTENLLFHKSNAAIRKTVDFSYGSRVAAFRKCTNRRIAPTRYLCGRFLVGGNRDVFRTNTLAAAIGLAFGCWATALTAMDIRPAQTVFADIAAIDQILVYNRFGSHNPHGMIFALRGDLTAASAVPTKLDAEACHADLGVDKTKHELEPGEVRLKDCKRPRPLVLRANEGDLLHLRVSNLLRPAQPGYSETFCRAADAPKTGWNQEIREAVSEGLASRKEHGEVACLAGTADKNRESTDGSDTDWPRTRNLNFAIQGLVAISDPSSPSNNPAAMADLQVCRGLDAIDPGEQVDCFYRIERQGPYFLSSNAAPAGGEGMGRLDNARPIRCRGCRGKWLALVSKPSLRSGFCRGQPKWRYRL